MASHTPEETITISEPAFSTAPRPSSNNAVSTTTTGRKQCARKEHRCTTCHQIFRRAEHLKRHIRRHTLERPFRCRQCLMSFSRNESYNRHQKTHHGHTSSTIPPPEIVPSSGEKAPLPTPHIQQLSKIGVESDNGGQGIPTGYENNTDVSQLEQTGLNDCNRRVQTPRRSITQQTTPANPSEQQSSVMPTIAQNVANRPGQDYRTVTPDSSEGTSLAAVQLLDLAFSNSFRDGYHQALLYSPSVNQNGYGYSPVDTNNMPEDDMWLSWQNSIHAPKPPGPHPFFTSGLDNPIPSTTSIVQSREIEESSTFNTLDDNSGGNLQAVVQNIHNNSQSPLNPQKQTTIPTTTTLQHYWKSYWLFSHQNISFLHPLTTTIPTTPPALLLSILASGATSCGAPEISISLFETSRRLVSQYLEACGGQERAIPLWVIQTLLLNAIFGLPGGGAGYEDVTREDFESLLGLARAVEAPSCSTSEFSSLSGHMEKGWVHFVEVESHKRTLLCTLIITNLWSTLYGKIQVNTSPFQNNLKMPASESLWTATSAAQWSALAHQPSLNPKYPPTLESAAESIFAGNGLTRTTGLSNLSQIISVLISVDELITSSSMEKHEILEHIEPALDTWTRSLLRGKTHRPENGKSNTMEMDTYTSFAVSMAAYVRLSLLVDAGAAMGLFLNCDFEKMRHSLRRGDLVAAAGRAVRGLGPGAGPGNRVSIGVVPCAIIVLEAALLSTSLTTPSTFLDAFLRQFNDSYNEAFSNNDANLDNSSSHFNFPTPLAFWGFLRRIIEGAPVTKVLRHAMDSYAVALGGELPFRQGGVQPAG